MVRMPDPGLCLEESPLLFKGARRQAWDKVECVTELKAKGQIFRSGLLLLIWLPRMDSNHRMPESESGALPLGDGAKRATIFSLFTLKNNLIFSVVAMGGLEPPTPAL